MPDILIRSVAQEVADVLDAHASAAGLTRNDWLLKQLIKLAEQPVIKQQYSIRCYGDHGAFCQIRRVRHDTSLRTGARECSQEQFDAYKKAQEYIQRNELGDREKALSLLGSVFDEVFEQ